MPIIESYPQQGEFQGTDEFGNPIYDRDVDAEFYREMWQHYFTNGVFNGGFSVRSNNNMTITVDAGLCHINGVTANLRFPIILTVIEDTPIANRIDRVVLRLDLVNRTIELLIKKNDTTLTRTENVWELGLADLAVKTNTSVPQADITDLRPNSEICGFVIGAVKQIDTTGAFLQYEARFNEWFADVQAQLGDDVAGNLINKINEVDVRLSTELEETKTNLFDQLSITPISTVKALALDNINKNNLCEVRKDWQYRLTNPTSLPVGDGRGVALCVHNNTLYKAVAQGTTPFVSTYYLDGTTWVRLSNPATVPTGVGIGVALKSHNNILYMAISHATTPFVSTYYLDGTTWVRLVNPSTLPTSTGNSVSLETHNNILYMAVAHDIAPFVSTYYLNGTNWEKLTDPATLPAGGGLGLALQTHNNTLYMAVTHGSSPYISTYYLNGINWEKLPNPTTLPILSGTGVAFQIHNNILYMAISHSNTPYISTYYLNGTDWVKLADPATRPSGASNGVGLYSHNNILYMAIAHSGTPFVSTYYLDGTTWVRLSNPATVPTGMGFGVALQVYNDVLYMAVAHATTPFVSSYIFAVANLISLMSATRGLGRARNTVNKFETTDVELWTV